MKSIRRAVSCVAALVLAALPAEGRQGDAQQACADRLKVLGQACLQYAQENDGKMPESLAVLLYQSYVGDLGAFACPATGHELAGRTDIDRFADYVLSPPSAGSGPRPVVQDRSPKNHGGAGINVFYSDGTVRWQAGAGPPVAPAAPPAPPAAAPPAVAGAPAPPPASGGTGASPAAGAAVPVPTAGTAPLAPAGASAVPARRARFGFVPGTHDGQGFPLVDVTAGSPAARAGLRPGDVVLEMAGRSFYGLRTPAAEVSAFAAALPPGMPVTMLVQRGMDRFALTVTPERAGVDADRGATAKAAYDEGRRLLAAGSFALAAQAFNTAIANDPGQPVLYVALAETFFRRNDANGELDALQRGASAAPSYRLYTLLGSACRRAGRYDEAIAAFSKAVAVMPPNLRDGGVYEQLGFCYMKKRRYQDALAQFDAAYAVNPRSPAAVYFLGGCHDVLHNRENAIRFYRDYLALRNNNAEWNKYAERRLDALARGAAAPSATGDQLLAFIDEFARSLAAVNANQPPGASPAPAGAPPAAAGATGRPAEPLAVPPGLRGSIEGEWTWADGSTVVIRGDGTCSSSNRLTGTWTLTDPAARRYTVVWSHGYSDVLTLASDGSRLDGKNSRGATIWATRRGR